MLRLWENGEGDGALIDVALMNRYTSEASISLRQETHPISQKFEWQIQWNSNMKLDQMGHLWCFNLIVLQLYNLRKRSSAHFWIIRDIYLLWCIFLIRCIMSGHNCKAVADAGFSRGGDNPNSRWALNLFYLPKTVWKEMDWHSRSWIFFVGTELNENSLTSSVLLLQETGTNWYHPQRS